MLGFWFCSVDISHLLIRQKHDEGLLLVVLSMNWFQSNSQAKFFCFAPFKTIPADISSTIYLSIFTHYHQGYKFNRPCDTRLEQQIRVLLHKWQLMAYKNCQKMSNPPEVEWRVTWLFHSFPMGAWDLTLTVDLDYHRLMSIKICFYFIQDFTIQLELAYVRHKNILM